MSYYQRYKNKTNQQQNTMRKMANSAMGFIYFIVGALIVFAPFIGISLSFPPQPLNYFFGSLICFYGAFRLYRAFLE